MSLRTSAAYIAVRIASGALAMASLALIVRGLGPAGYGQLTLGLAASAVVTLVLFNPLNSMLARFYGDVPLRPALLGLLRAIMLGIGILLVCTAWVAEEARWTPLSSHILVAAACMALAQGMFDFTGQYLAAGQQSLRYSLQFLGKALLTLLLAWLVLRAGGDAVAVLLAMAASFLIAALSGAGVRGWLHVPRAAERALLPILASFAGPLLLTSLLGYLLLWGDRYLLQQLVPLAELGRYSAVADLAQQTLGLIFSGLCTAWYPRMVLAWGQEDFAETQRLLGRYAALGLAVALPAGIGFALLLPAVVPLMYGAAYTQLPAGLLPLVTAAACVAAVKAYYFDLPLLLARRVWRHSASIAGSALASLLMGWLLVPRLGTAGAALGLLLGQTLGIGLSLWAGRGVLSHRLPLALLWPPVLGAVLMGALLLNWPVTGWFGVLGKSLAGAVVYGMVMLMADFDGVRARLTGRRT